MFSRSSFSLRAIRCGKVHIDMMYVLIVYFISVCGLWAQFFFPSRLGLVLAFVPEVNRRLAHTRLHHVIMLKVLALVIKTSYGQPETPSSCPCGVQLWIISCLVPASDIYEDPRSLTS